MATASIPLVAESEIKSAAAIFGVADVERAAEHYRDRIGFHIEGMWKDMGYAIVRRGPVEIHLQQLERSDPTPADRDSIYVFVNDADAFFAEMEARGNVGIKRPENRTYGRRDFGVEDLDGHHVFFSGPPTAS